MRIALVHDALVNRGGAERVAATLCEAFPGAPLYTSVYLPERTYPAFRDVDVRPTGLQSVIRSERALKATFPLALWAMSRLTLRGYDVVLTSSTFAAKFVRVPAGTPHVCYCYTPFRLAWDPASYDRDGQSALRHTALRAAAALLRPADRRAAARVHRFVTMTQETRERIQRAYGREAAVLRPPIDCAAYRGAFTRRGHFLLVSRLEPYKRVEVVIEAFGKLGAPLLVVGDGSQAAHLREKAGANISFLGVVGDDELRRLYAEAEAVLFPQREDYGLVPLEAIASGTPVIAYAAGGVLETMVPVTADGRADRATALFFHRQSPAAVVDAVTAFRSLRFEPAFLREHASRFDKAAFIAGIRRHVQAAVD